MIENGKKLLINGEEWTIYFPRMAGDKKLESCDGYTDWTKRAIVVCDLQSDDASIADLDEYERKVLRHEIIHAYLFSCGLGHGSGSVDAWAVNEEMVDFFAFNGVKIYNLWVKAGALPKNG